MEFIKFNSIPRFQREWVATEKIDGTNAQVLISEWDEDFDPSYNLLPSGQGLYLFAGSRSRWLKPAKQDDNFNFAAFVASNADELLTLGPGRHFGEWWGHGIQRGYGQTEKRFTLFWAPRNGEIPECVSGVVPEVGCEDDPTLLLEQSEGFLRSVGSLVAPGFKNPEGIVLTHTPSRTFFKYTFDGDGHKSLKAA